MVRSLYSGISGLRNHQTAMDVTGNNIANVNTTGFKMGRVTFEEAMSQMIKGSTRPSGGLGGKNAMQIGLGMSVGSIDTILTQGGLQSTGKVTDLALEGTGYLVYSNGEGNFYSRNGALQMDSEGRLVSPTNGFVLQGMMAAPDGTYPPGSTVGDVRIPFGEKAPAEATTQVSYSSNLDSDSMGLGTIVHSNRFLATVEGTDTLTSLLDSTGNDLGIRVGDTLTISATNPSTGATETFDFPVTDGATLDGGPDSLASAIESFLVMEFGAGTATVDLQADGTLQVNLAGEPPSLSVSQLTVGSSRPGSNSYVSNMFTWDATMSGGNTYDSNGAGRAPATADDSLANVFDASGNPLGLEDGATPLDPSDEITINGAVGGRSITPVTVAYTSDPTDPNGVSNLGQLLTVIQQAFNLPDQVPDGGGNLVSSVEMNPAGTANDRLPDGAIVVRGQPEEAFAISNLSISASNADNDPTAPTRFIANSSTTEIQQARDTAVHSTSIVVYDESGDSHTMTTIFTHSGTPGEWLWEIQTEGGEEIIGGNMGRITFGQDGSPASFTFDDGSTTFRFDPMNGSNEVEVRLNVGSPGSFEGITQFRSPSTTAARDQDGYPMGKLQEISINEEGEISGLYTNGVNKSIARVYVAEFNNAAGLVKVGDSMLAQSNNSGEGVLRRPGVGTSTKMKPGSLEMSNVDLASEFTNMITTQRGYQANARVITTSDSLLDELVRLVR